MKEINPHDYLNLMQKKHFVKPEPFYDKKLRKLRIEGKVFKIIKSI